MLTSYRALEKMLGSEKLPLPRDEADREGYERIYKALGRPESRGSTAAGEVRGHVEAR